ncbi:hypothetical protein FBU30_007071 [Linnemannia zychae]|nr:hypothetical protein FBU30_007071 [Linnemannia zychae]
MKEYGIILCETEEYPKIAIDCQPVDVVVIRDSDFMGYRSVRTIRRVVGHSSTNKCLIYSKYEILTALEMTDVQLQTLVCVSKSSHHCNIRNLALKSNYDIIMALGDRENVETLIQDYLCHAKLRTNNVMSETFTNALKVFTRMEQTVAQDGMDAQESVWSDMCRCFQDLKSQYRGQKKIDYEARQETIDSSSQATSAVHRCRIIDLPPVMQQGDASDVIRFGKLHRHRLQYSINERGQPKKQNPPEIVEQYNLKPVTTEQERHWCSSQNEHVAKKDRSDKAVEKRTKGRKAEKKATTSIESMTKAELVASLKH